VLPERIEGSSFFVAHRSKRAFWTIASESAAHRTLLRSSRRPCYCHSCKTARATQATPLPSPPLIIWRQPFEPRPPRAMSLAARCYKSGAVLPSAVRSSPYSAHQICMKAGIWSRNVDRGPRVLYGCRSLLHKHGYRQWGPQVACMCQSRHTRVFVHPTVRVHCGTSNSMCGIVKAPTMFNSGCIL
jgi:hypothetical protein